MHGREGETDSLDQARLLDGYSLGKEGHWTFSTKGEGLLQNPPLYGIKGSVGSVTPYLGIFRV